MEDLNHLLYSKTHKWVQFLSEDTARIGVSDFAQKKLKNVIFAALPDAGDSVTAGVSFGELESVKTISDLISPVSGQVSAVNTEVMDDPEAINRDPYGAWLIEVTGITDREPLMDSASFEAYCAE